MDPRVSEELWNLKKKNKPMEIKKTTLIDALEIVKPGVANKELIEQANSFAFLNGRVATYNDEISISHPIEDLPLTGAINADNLYNFVNKISGGTISLEIVNNEIIVTSGRSKAGFALYSEVTLPLMNIDEIKHWKELPEHFLKHMKFAAAAASTDVSQMLLTCVHIDAKGFIEASDGNRIVQCTLPSELSFSNFLLPSRAALQVIRLAPTSISRDKGWVHFKNEDNTVISCRVLEEKYPNIKAHLKIKGKEITFPQSTQEVLERASVFSKRDYVLDESVIITIADKRLTVKSASSTGWFEEKLNINYTDTPISFAITPYLLRDILSETFHCIISESRIRFEGSDWLYIAALGEQEKTEK